MLSQCSRPSPARARSTTSYSRAETRPTVLFNWAALTRATLSSALAIAVTSCTLLFLLPLAVRHFWPKASAIPPIIIPFDGGAQPGSYVLPKPVLPPAAPTHPLLVVMTHAQLQTHVVPDQQVKPAVAAQLPQNIGPAGPATTGTENTTGVSAGTGSGVATGAGVDSAQPAPTPEIGICRSDARVCGRTHGSTALFTTALMFFRGGGLAAPKISRGYEKWLIFGSFVGWLSMTNNPAGPFGSVFRFVASLISH